MLACVYVYIVCVCLRDVRVCVVCVFVVRVQQTAKEQDQVEEVNGATERSSEDQMSVHTLSLHPGEFGFVCVPVRFQTDSVLVLSRIVLFWQQSWCWSR